MKNILYCSTFSSEAGRALGLKNVYHLPWDHGAWFVFPVETTSGFWMKDTPIPLEIIFINSSYTIISIHNLKPHDSTIIKCEGPYKYALEVNPGWSESNNIRPGDDINTKVDLIFVRNISDHLVE